MYEIPILKRIDTGESEEERICKAIELLTNEKECNYYMNLVIQNWEIACEQHLTNKKLNQKLWLCKAACCMYAGITETETLKCWNILNTNEKNEVYKIAESIITKWLNMKGNLI